MDFDLVVEYINEHLKDEITLKDIGDLIGYSPWYVYKLFKEYSNLPIMEYIRKQRLTAAANEIHDGRKLLDIALDYGFETPSGFYKAFQNMFGCSPSEYKRHNLKDFFINYNVNIQKLIIEMESGDGEMDINNLIIRKVELRDAQSFRDNLTPVNTLAETQERISNSLKGMEEKSCVRVVAEYDEQIIGTLVIKHDKTWALAPHTGELRDELIVGAFKGLGIEKMMFDKCKDFVKECGITLLRGSQRECMADYYRELGFTELGTIPDAIIDPWGEHLHHGEVIFYMQLE